jgi:hypothetical protein
MSALEVYLSGDSGNTDPLMSIGGRVSVSGDFSFQTFVQDTALPGVTIDRLGNNAIGSAVLSYEKMQNGAYLFRWTPESTDSFAGRVVSASGRYGLATAHGIGNGFVVLDIDVLALSANVASTSVTVRNTVGTLFSEVSEDEAYSGMVDYRCVYLKNAHTSKTFTNGLLEVRRISGLPSSLAVGADFSGAGDGITTGVATTPVDRFTSPGVLFGQQATIPTLAPGQYAAVWIRRTIPEGWFIDGVDSNLLLVSGEF